jgi:hypothetical protein
MKSMFWILIALSSGLAQAAPAKLHPVKGRAAPQLSADELSRFIQSVSRHLRQHR